MSRHDPRVWSAFVVLLASLFAAAPLPAQTHKAPPGTTGGSARTTLLKGGEMLELLSVYVPRNESEVQRLAADSRDTEAGMTQELEKTRTLATAAEGRARIMKEEQEATRVRRDVARKSKDAAATAELEAAYVRQDREQSYLEDLRNALRADIDRIEAEREAAASRTKALELELRVVQRYREITNRDRKSSGADAKGGAGAASEARTAATTAEAPTPGQTAEYRSLLRDMLDAQRDAAGRWSTAAARRQALAEKKIKQLDAYTRLTAPSTGR